MTAVSKPKRVQGKLTTFDEMEGILKENTKVFAEAEKRQIANGQINPQIMLIDVKGYDTKKLHNAINLLDILYQKDTRIYFIGYDRDRKNLKELGIKFEDIKVPKGMALTQLAAVQHDNAKAQNASS